MNGTRQPRPWRQLPWRISRSTVAEGVEAKATVNDDGDRYVFWVHFDELLHCWVTIVYQNDEPIEEERSDDRIEGQHAAHVFAARLLEGVAVTSTSGARRRKEASR